MRKILIDEHEAAAFLGCSVHKMQRDRRIGSPIPYIKVGRSVRYELARLESYVAQHTFSQTTEYAHTSLTGTDSNQLKRSKHTQGEK